MLPSKHGYFHPILILPVKMVELPQQYITSTLHWLHGILNPTITNGCKEVHLKCGRVPRSVFENVVMHENLSGFV